MNFTKLKIPKRIPKGVDPVSYIRGYNGANKCKFTRKEIKESLSRRNLQVGSNEDH